MAHYDAICVYKYNSSSTPDAHYGSYYWVSGEDEAAVYAKPGVANLLRAECAGIYYYYIDLSGTCPEGMPCWAKSTGLSGPYATQGGDYLAWVSLAECAGEQSASTSSTSYVENWSSSSTSSSSTSSSSTSSSSTTSSSSYIENWSSSSVSVSHSSSSTSYIENWSSSSSSTSSSSTSSSSSSTSSSSTSTSSSSTENVWTLIGYLCVEINGSDTKNHYLPLYNNAHAGTPSDRDFWGDIVASPTNLAEDGWISNTINGTTRWLHVYTADPSSSCCSNIQGAWRPI